MHINWTCTITFALLTVIIYLILCQIIHTKEQQGGDMMDGMDFKKFLTSCEFLIFVGAGIAFNLNQWFYPPCKM